MLDEPARRLFIEAQIFPSGPWLLDMLDLLEVLLHSCQLPEDRVFSRIYAIKFQYGYELSQTSDLYG
jgi:hypothetical protein